MRNSYGTIDCLGRSVPLPYAVSFFFFGTTLLSCFTKFIPPKFIPIKFTHLKFTYLKFVDLKFVSQKFIYQIQVHL